MILGTGIDILQRSRIKEDMARRILSEAETEVFEGFDLPKRRLEYLAGRFALKEAIIKAIGHTDHHVGMRDITILNDPSGMPYLVSPTDPKLRFHISLSHETDYCVALCIIESV